MGEWLVMARSQYYTDPSRKHIEVYQDFSGGLNTVTSNDNLLNKELVELTNIDLGERGSLKRRNGMMSHLVSPVLGKGQGYFKYFKNDGTYDEIMAVDGKLYKDGAELPITGLASFQNTRNVEAVQFREKLYIATGTKLVEYDGTSASVVTPYTPDPLEALYIGTNGLADDPDSYISDGVGATLQVNGVHIDKRYGAVNKKSNFSIFITKPDTMTVEYMLEYIGKDGETWLNRWGWVSDSVIEFKPSSVRDYEMRVKVRDANDVANEVEYYIPKYTVKSTDENVSVDTSTIHNCNRVTLHWNRLVMYGDSSNKDMIYVSHLSNPTYFPTLNTIRFENEWKEELTSLVHYRDMLVAFTPSGIQALYGKSPLDFRRVVLHSGIGCIAPETAKITNNSITFLSRDGVYILKSVGYTEERANVEKIDKDIESLVTPSYNACAITFEGQYHLVLPDEKKRFRFYFDDLKVWTKDESDKLDFIKMHEWDGELYGQSGLNGSVLKFDKNTWSDDGQIYSAVIETKDFDFGQPYNPKKLKEIQLLLATNAEDVNMSAYVYADDSAVLNPDSSYATVEDGAVVWKTVNTANLSLEAGSVFGAWELGEDSFGSVSSKVSKLRLSGKCRRTKLKLVHKEESPAQLLGLAYIFKVKKP